jgi:hypothetical protein
MATKCTVRFQRGDGPFVTECLDDINTDYGVLNIIFGGETPEGPRRLIYAPGVWTSVEVEMMDEL